MADGRANRWKDTVGHVIVFGLHGLGLRIVEQLHLAGVEVLVVDDRPDIRLTRVLEEWGVARVPASPDVALMLADAGIAGARSVIAVADDDLHALEVALVAHNARRELRVVLRMVNTAVAGAVAEVTGPGSVLDVAALAAPSVVETCLSQRTHPLELGGERFTVQEMRAAASASLRDLYGDLAPIAVVSADGESVELCPGRDHPVQAGDRVLAVGTDEELRSLGALTRHQRTHHRRPSRVTVIFRRTWRAVLALHQQATLPIRVTFAALVVLLGISTLVLHLAYRRPGGMSVLDALYFTTETVATVGFGDFTYSSQSAWLEIFGVLLIIGGVGLVTALLALVTNVLVSRGIAQTLGYGRVDGMRDHAVVIGLGAIGLRVMEGLVAEGMPVMVVERDEDNRHLARARTLRVPVLIGDATLDGTLEGANVRSSAAVAVMTSDDLTNIETGLAVRSHLGEGRRSTPLVLRVFDRDLGRMIERDFGFHHVRSTSALAAPWFVGAALGLDVLSTFYVERELLLVAGLTVASSGGLAGLAMRDLTAQIRVVALARADGGHLEHPPRRDTRFAPGDRAYLIGPYRELLVALRRDAEAKGRE